MPDGVTFNVSELGRMDRGKLEKRLRNYSKHDEDLYRALNFYLGLAIEHVGRLRGYTYVRINENGILIPSRTVGGKGVPYSSYVPFHLT